jgi:cytochrome c-type biogenesis protein CcmE
VTVTETPGAGSSGADGHGGLDDLTPRTVVAPRRRRWPAIVAVAVIAIAIGLLLTNALGSASLFFKNADEAVNERAALGDKRFRMQGTVIDGSVADTEVDGQGAVRFSVSFHDVRVDVVHIGEPLQLFKPGVPVVLEGAWVNGASPDGKGFPCGANDGWHFASDRMLVKHDNVYEAEQSDRLAEAQSGSGATGCAVAAP